MLYPDLYTVCQYHFRRNLRVIKLRLNIEDFLLLLRCQGQEAALHSQGLGMVDLLVQSGLPLAVLELFLDTLLEG